MAKGFEVNVKSFPDYKNDETLTTEIETWLDSLNVGSSHEVYQITSFHSKGFYQGYSNCRSIEERVTNFLY